MQHAMETTRATSGGTLIHLPEISRRSTNVSPMERWASLATGGGLVLYGLTRGSLTGFATALIGGSLLYRGATGHCDLYGALGINTAEYPETGGGVRAKSGTKVEKSILINRSPEELFQFWRRFENLPQVMDHLISVTSTEGNRSHWVAKGPLGTAVEWDAEIHNERENALIAWQSLPGGDVDTAGSVHFDPAPNGEGTQLRVSLKFDPPGGAVGVSMADFLGNGLEASLEEDLRQFKQTMETGERSPTAGQPSDEHQHG